MAEDDTMKLAGDFPPVTHEDWLAAVERTVEGDVSVTRLRSVTADGLVVEPLYTEDPQPSLAQFPFGCMSRRISHVGGLIQGWDIRQEHRLITTVDDLNDAILTDLESGVTSIELATAGLERDSLAAALGGVRLDLAPISFVSADCSLGLRREFLALVSFGGLSPESFSCYLGCDPIGSLVKLGSVGQPINKALAEVGKFAAEVSERYPLVRTVRADGIAFANAGASPATELAVIISLGVSYLRALTDAGLSVPEALRQILLVVTVGTDQFGDIAKLRALRVLWTRVAEASGVNDNTAIIQATTSAVGLTTFDPWVNVLRATIGCFAAACGGADAITLAAFDSVAGTSGQLGFRLARNTQLVLAEESNLHRVIDPGGGSWYIETLTDQLAAEAWKQFQMLERSGGVVENLISGALQTRIRKQWEELELRVATRERLIVGVTEFPNLDDPELERTSDPVSPENAVGEVEVLPQRRLAADFEALRRLANARSVPPAVFLANIGDLATYRTRVEWVTNIFESGGIAVIQSAGFEDDAVMVKAFESSAARIAVICSSDAIYRERGLKAVTSLRAAGAEVIFLVGQSREDLADYETTGIDDFIYVGCNALAILGRAHEVIGVDR